VEAGEKTMADNTADAILLILKRMQADIAELKQMRQEMREGFASVKSHMTGMVGDVFSHERRILNLEDEMLKLRRKIELPEESEH
jgi:hypothetical protein